MAFEIIKPRFLFSCGPNIIKKKITKSPNMKLELCSSECPCLSKQSCCCFPPLRNCSLGFRFPIPCSWDLQSHAAEARLVLYIRTYNRSPPFANTRLSITAQAVLRPIHKILYGALSDSVPYSKQPHNGSSGLGPAISLNESFLQ